MTNESNLATTNFTANKAQDIRKTDLHPDFWYPVSQAKKLKKNKPLAVKFAGDPIVLVRTESNSVFALEDLLRGRREGIDSLERVPGDQGVARARADQWRRRPWCPGTGRRGGQ